MIYTPAINYSTIHCVMMNDIRGLIDSKNRSQNIIFINLVFHFCVLKILTDNASTKLRGI